MRRNHPRAPAVPAFVIVLACALSITAAHAQSPAGDDTPIAPDDTFEPTDEPTEASDPAAAADAAFGGVFAVGRVRPIGAGPMLSFALSSGYAYTEDLYELGTRHDRAMGALAIAVRPIPWLELGGQLSGRYDRHGPDDDGLVGDPRLFASAGGRVGRAARLGVQLGVWLPGANAPSVELDATTVDGSLVFTYAPGATAITARAGYRLDRSSRSIDASMLSPSDRLALGVSDFDAAIAGLGVVHRTGAWQLLAEASTEQLLGFGHAAWSPSRLGAGVRRALGDALVLEAIVEASISGRQTHESFMTDLIPVEPRAAIGLGLSWRPSPARPRARLATTDTPDRVVVEPPPPPPTTGPVRGRVVDDQGAPVGGAEVTVGATTVETAEDGTFTVADVKAGDVAVTVDRDGFQRGQAAAAVVVTTGAQVEITLVRIKPPPVIRGLVRGFDGKGLPARIRVEPLGLEVTAGADGAFSIETVPGTYTVVITHDGYVSQRINLTLEEDEVESRSVELQRARGPRRP